MEKFIRWIPVRAFICTICFIGISPNGIASTDEARGGACDFLIETSRVNCLKFLSDPEIPQDALKWTLGVMRDNSNGLRMNQCLLEPSPDHYSNLRTISKNIDRPAVTRETLNEGIKNKCQVMINDTRRPWPGGSKWQGTYYFLDVCNGAKKSGYFNMGKGTILGKSYSNISGKKSTVLGAFLTSSETFSYGGSDGKNGKKKYKAIKKNYGRIAAVSLFGLQNTNNGSDRDKKYMHVSPFSSSWGCPSLRAEDAPIIDELAERGPSLVVNYGPEEFMEDPKKCTGTSTPHQRPRLEQVVPVKGVR